MAATLTSPPYTAHAFRPVRRVDPRLLVGGGLGLLAAVGMLWVLSQVVPVQQEVLQLTRDIPAGAVLQATDVASARVRIPDTMTRDAIATADVDRIVGSRVAVPLHAGHLLAASDLAPRASAIPAGRTRLAIAWDPPAGVASEVNPGDAVVVYSTPRQGAATADVLIPRATVVRIVRPQLVTSGTGSFGATAGDARATSVVLDLDVVQAARLAAASHTSTLDIAPIGPGGGEPVNLRRRVVLGVGRAQERRLLEYLTAAPTLQLVARCNSALEVVARLEQDDVDVLVLDDDLHLLDVERLKDLTRRRRVPIVLLVHDPDGARWHDLQAVVLLATATSADILEGIDRASRRNFGRSGVAGDRQAVAPLPTRNRSSASNGGATRVVALFGGPGAPGRTSIAVNVLAVLGATRRAVLVDLDMTGAAVAAYLRGVHPAWNIVDIAIARPQTREAWEQFVEDRLQPIGSFSPGARVLCGVARPKHRSHISPGFVEQLVGHLALRFDHVLLDVGDEPLSGSGSEAMVTAAALTASDHVLLVAAADPLSLHHAQLAREDAANLLDPDRTSLVMNRCDSSQDAASGVAALKLPLAAVLPSDARVRRALVDGQPAVCDARSRIRRPIAELAGRIAADSLVAPAIQESQQQRTGRFATFRSLLAPVTGMLGGVRS